MLNDIMDSIKKLPQEEFASIQSFIVSEYQRRQALPQIEQAQAEIITNLRDNGVIEKPAEPADPADVKAYPQWVDPGTNHQKMYLLDDKVQHDGRVWESTHNGLNSWQPGAEGVYDNVWKDVTVEVSPPPAEVTDPANPEEGGEAESIAEFKQPTGAHDSYKKGDKVRFNGETYISKVDGNSYSPADYAPNWEKV